MWFWKRRRRVVLSLREIYEQRWRDQIQRDPTLAEGDPLAPKCRGCGRGKTRHRAAQDDGDPVLWCANCDGG